MYSMPEGYRKALADCVAQVDVYIAIGSDIDPTAADDMTAVEGDFLPMSNPEQITDANYLITRTMATFEGDGIRTGTDAGNIAPPLSPREYPPQVGLWSSGISDGQGVIDWPITLRFGRPHRSALTLFTQDTQIMDAEVVFFKGGAQVRSGHMVPGSGRVMFKDPVEYDEIRIRVLKVDRPYSHVRISEVEFGASVTYSKTRLMGTVTLVKEWDPLMQSIPLHELDFSILNVLGEYDPDNPNGLYATIKQDYPVELSYSITANDGTKWTVPCGRFMIASKTASDGSLDIVALDARSALANNRGGLTIDPSVSFGDTFKELFKALNVPFQVDEGLFSEYPIRAATFDGERYDLLTIMRFLEQFYSIWLVPERGGSIRATHEVPTGDYGSIDPDMVVKFPRSDVERSFNFISVSYGPEGSRRTYTEDLRTDTNQLRSQVAINNPLLMTEREAMDLAGRIRAALYSERVETEWRGDPAMDITDMVAVPGKWTPDNPTRYRALYSELTYNGGLIERTTTYR